MIKKFFKKKKERTSREKVQISIKYNMLSDKDDIADFENIRNRGIIEDINKQGIRITVTPIFDKRLIKKVKEKKRFMYVSFTLPPDNVPINTKTVICWLKNDMKKFPAVTIIGMEFISLSMEEKVHINRFITLKKREEQ